MFRWTWITETLSHTYSSGTTAKTVLSTLTDCAGVT